MINPKTKERELCYLVTVDKIEEIPGRDFTECAVIGGWKTLVRKNLFKPGDIGIYIENSIVHLKENTFVKEDLNDEYVYSHYRFILHEAKML